MCIMLDYIDYMDYLPAPAPRRRPDDVEDHFNSFSDTEFIDRYRFSKDNVRFLIEKISPFLSPVDDRAPHTVPHCKQILIALRYFATGNYHRETGDLLACSESTACKFVHRVAFVICQTMGAEYIKFPTGEYASRTKFRFFEKYGFPGVLSVVDGTHVPIICPSTADKEEYRNRKGYFSINVMATTGADLEFTNIVARWKGSTHDSRVLKNSRLYSKFEDNEMNGLMLADSGYECNRFIITPLATPTTPAEWRFQRSFKRARSSVERAFGLWKSRFRCVHTENMLRFSPRRCCIIITACAVLHNFGIRRKQWEDELFDRSDESSDEEEDNERRHELDEGVFSRLDLIKRYFTN